LIHWDLRFAIADLRLAICIFAIADLRRLICDWQFAMAIPIGIDYFRFGHNNQQSQIDNRQSQIANQ
jgi:hypothetical protein